MERKKVLIIDDESSYRGMARLILEEKGYAVLEADDGNKGIERAGKERPNLILLDINMPQIDGLETLKILKAGEKTKNIPVVMCTIQDKVGDIDKSFAAGAAGYVIKPYEPEKILEKIKGILDKGV